jgi:hypothetical protein
MPIIDLTAADERLLEALAQLSHAAAAEHAPAWLPTLEAAREQVREALEPVKIGRVLLDDAGTPLGGSVRRRRGERSGSYTRC